MVPDISVKIPVQEPVSVPAQASEAEDPDTFRMSSRTGTIPDRVKVTGTVKSYADMIKAGFGGHLGKEDVIQTFRLMQHTSISFPSQAKLGQP